MPCRCMNSEVTAATVAHAITVFGTRETCFRGVHTWWEGVVGRGSTAVSSISQQLLIPAAE